MIRAASHMGSMKIMSFLVIKANLASIDTVNIYRREVVPL